MPTKTWQKFCLVHSAVCVDPEKSFGNSMLLINPYSGTVVAGLRGTGDKLIRIRIPTKLARMVDLEPVAEPGNFPTVLMSSSNWITAHDVRHPYGCWQAFNSIDHLDTFSGIATRYQTSTARSMRQLARRGARWLGHR